MSSIFFPRVKRQNLNDALVQHKTKPVFLIPKEKEFHPHSPCQACFPLPSDSNTYNYEELGVRNLLTAVQPSRKCLVSLHHVLLQNFKTLQVHWGQLEQLEKIKVPKLYVGILYTKWDVQVLRYTITVGLQESIEFYEQSDLKKYMAEISVSNQLPSGVCSKVLFIDHENSDSHLEAVKSSLVGNDKADILLVPISISYEFPPDRISSRVLHESKANSEWKTSVRVNFGLPHSVKNFICKEEDKINTIPHLKKHMRHEIWMNTPIMSVHILSMILQYRVQTRDAESRTCVQLMNEFQKRHRQHRDLAFVGELKDVIRYSTKVLFMEGVVPFPSTAVDVMKLESIIMKSLFSLVPLMEVDLHSDTCRVSQADLLENYRKMAGLLRHEIDFITPPCSSASVVEKRVLDYLIDNQVLSQQSDEPNSSEQQMAKRMAYHLDLDSDEEEEWADRPAVDTLLYVNIANALSHKWIARIATKLLDIYYIGAKQLLELREVDVMEESIFIQRVLESRERDSSGSLRNHFTPCYSHLDLLNLSHVILVDDMDSAIRNSLKLFESEGIIDFYSHSGIKILYLKDPLSEKNLWRLIHDIAQHC